MVDDSIAEKWPQIFRVLSICVLDNFKVVGKEAGHKLTFARPISSTDPRQNEVDDQFVKIVHVVLVCSDVEQGSRQEVIAARIQAIFSCVTNLVLPKLAHKGYRVGGSECSEQLLD